MIWPPGRVDLKRGIWVGLTAYVAVDPSIEILDVVYSTLLPRGLIVLSDREVGVWLGGNVTKLQL